jgi:hypothetical protein
MATTADDGAVTTGSAGQGAPVDQYQHIADTYQAAVTGEPLWTHTTDATIKSLIGNDRSALEGKAVIDLACGEGVFARWAITQGAASTGGRFHARAPAGSGAHAAAATAARRWQSLTRPEQQ